MWAVAVAKEGTLLGTVPASAGVKGEKKLKRAWRPISLIIPEMQTEALGCQPSPPRWKRLSTLVRLRVGKMGKGLLQHPVGGGAEVTVFWVVLPASVKLQTTDAL